MREQCEVESHVVTENVARLGQRQAEATSKQATHYPRAIVPPDKSPNALLASSILFFNTKIYRGTESLMFGI
jgi:hypothetical protein